MIKTSENPWHDMPNQTSRRVDPDLELFWITDMDGDYGFCIRSDKPFQESESSYKLKGVSVQKRNTEKESGELLLVLNNSDEWEIFNSLCLDLISVSKNHIDNKSMIHATENRLNRWQKLLKLERCRAMSKEMQMGLYSELSCLKDIVAPKKGIKNAIKGWVGAERDKQDFLLDDSIIEVKSYRTSKGATAHISSLAQLHSDKEPIFLISYALTLSDKGKSVVDLVEEIEVLMQGSDAHVRDMLEDKLLEYGFIPELIESSLDKFVVDAVRSYEVKDDFPRIHIQDVPSSITKLQYAIDLNRCDKFQCQINEML